MTEKLQIHLKSSGYGRRCKACRQVGYTTSCQLWRGEQLRWNVLLCEQCLEKGVIAHIKLENERNTDPLERKAIKSRIKRSQEMETALAKKVGGRTQPGSGNSKLPGFKGDVRKVGKWRLEHKFTDAIKGWYLKLSDLAKIISLAMEAGENPGLVIEFAKVKDAFAIIPLSLFLEMINDEDDEHPRPSKRRRRS